MRPVKFRAVRYTDGVLEKIYDVTGIDYDEDFGVFNARLKNNEWLINIIPLQSTDLKDKNGTEIFEGDIVKRTYLFDGGYGETHTGKIVYDKEYARYIISRPQKHIEPKTEDLRNTLSDKSTYEVIGNIYENRELLEEI